MSWTPPEDPRDPPICHTPIPQHVDAEIDRLALQLAKSRRDLAPGARLMLASILAYRTRSFKRQDPHG